MSIFGFGPDHGWSVAYYFALRGTQGTQVGLHGTGFPVPPWESTAMPLNVHVVHAVWGDTVEDKQKIIESIALAYHGRRNSDYLSSIQWINNRPSRGHDTLTHIATRSEVVSPAHHTLTWKDEHGNQKSIRTDKILLTTDIYNIQNIWLLFHTLEPPDAEPQFVSFLNTEKQRLVTQAKEYRPGNVNKAILFYGLIKVPRLIPMRQQYEFIAFLMYHLVVLPTIPVAVLLFVPMFLVPNELHELFGVISWLYFIFLVAVGVLAFRKVVRSLSVEQQ